jgi:hypothetical protein
MQVEEGTAEDTAVVVDPACLEWVKGKLQLVSGHAES